MRILNVEQNTDEWRDMRRSKIGASDVATLMTGTDREIYDLYLEKVEGKDKFQTDAMRRGSDMEADARKWAEQELGITFERPVGLHDEHNWLIASFDGLNFELGLSLEIKCPNIVPDRIEDSKQWQRYYWQVQAQLAVGGHEKAILLAYSPTKQVQATIERNEADILKLIAQGQWFHGLVESRTPPMYKIELDDEQWAREVIEASIMEKTAKVKLGMLKQDGIQKSGGLPFDCCGVKMVYSDGGETIDYKKAIETLLPNADLSAFKKKIASSWKLIPPKVDLDQLGP